MRYDSRAYRRPTRITLRETCWAARGSAYPRKATCQVRRARGHSQQVRAGGIPCLQCGQPAEGTGEPHTIQLLQRLGYETLSFRSKSWNEFARLGAPALDLKEANMDNTTLLIIIILVVILLGGGWYGRGRWF